MSPIRVWAPAADSVELVTPDDRRPMSQSPVDTDRGWWESEADLSAGALYKFALADGLVPDPRSPRQPEGPEGWSQTVDHTMFEWSDWEWTGFPLAAAVIYELHVGTFSPAGTFDGAIDKLDELADLGVSAIEIMPVATFPGTRGWGYDLSLIHI